MEKNLPFKAIRPLPSRLLAHLRTSIALFGKKWYYGTNLQAIGFLVFCYYWIIKIIKIGFSTNNLIGFRYWFNLLIFGNNTFSMKYWNTNRVEISNTVFAENAEKRLESRLKTIKLYGIITKVHKIICFTHIKISFPVTFLTRTKTLGTNAIHTTPAKF